MKQKDDCGIMIKRINDILERDANNSLRRYGLTTSQAGILVILDQAGPAGMPLKALEEKLHVKQPTAAGIISRMAKSGFLEYFEDPDDGRAKNVRITEQGRTLTSQGAYLMKKAEKALLAPLSTDEAETFRNCLEKICRSLN